MKIWKKINRLKRRLRKYRNINKKYRENPVEPWAFIRVKNEIKTVQACLESIIPVIKKGVIGYHKLSENEVDDGTEEYLKKFCKENPKYILFKYDFTVIPANDIRYEKLDNIPLENRLDSYYNAVLSKIPQNEWFIKIDCDHVYDTDKLKKLMYLPKKDTDIISYSRLNLHYEDGKLYVIKNPTLFDGGDSQLLKKENIYFDFFQGHKEGKFFAYEGIVIPKGRKFYNTDLFNWHFPFVKTSRDIEKEKLLEFNKVKFSLYDKLYYHIKKDMIDEERIMEICKNFK